eukprot:scaffold644_cov168-Ochromonas_danica.AAC.54
MNLLRNIGSFLGLTSPTHDVKSILEEEHTIHSKDELAEEIMAGRILMTDAIKRYGYSRSALRAAVNKRQQLNNQQVQTEEEDPIQHTSSNKESSVISSLPSAAGLPDSEKLDMIFHVVEEELTTIKAACLHFGVTLAKFRNERKKRKREECGEEPIQKAGRKPSINNQNKMRLQEEAHHKDLTKDSFTSQTLGLQIQKLRQEEAIEHGSNAASVKPVSKRTLARLALQVTPKLVRNAQTQNVRRLQALTDAFSPVTHVTVIWTYPSNADPIGVLEKREEMRDKKRREREAKVSRELEKARKAAAQGEKQRIMEHMESGALSGKKGNPSYLQVGNPFFCTNPVCSQQRRVPREN